jgi:4-amino-4-deoxychorismate lyase
VSATVLVNGEPTPFVDAADRGFQYGDGVFTTLPVRQGTPLFLAEHLARLERDCRRLFLPVPERAALVREALALCAARPDGVLKIQLTRGVGGRGYRCPEPALGARVLSVHPPPDYPEGLGEEGVEVRVCRARLGINPLLAGLKHTNRLEQILARAEWPPGDIREGLMLDTEGHVTEGTMSNLFLVKDGAARTPKLDLCGVAGVMRGLVMAGLGELGLAVEECRIFLDEVRSADELFLTNSVIGLWPVRRLEGRDFAVGPVTRGAQRWLKTKILEYLKHPVRPVAAPSA